MKTGFTIPVYIVRTTESIFTHFLYFFVSMTGKAVRYVYVKGGPSVANLIFSNDHQ